MANDATKTPAATEQKAKKRRKGWQIDFPTPEAAEKEAKERTEGPRRAFKATRGGKTIYMVHNNELQARGHAAAVLVPDLELVELGERAAKVKNIGVAGILAAVNALPETERATVMAQLKALTGAKK